MADLKQLKILGVEVITADKDIINVDNITCSGLWVASGQSGQLLRVNSAENALEYSDPTEIPGLVGGFNMKYMYDSTLITSTTPPSPNPASGKFRFDSATMSSVTKVSISTQGLDSVYYTDTLATIFPGAKLIFKKSDTVSHVFEVKSTIDANYFYGYFLLEVEHLSGSATGLFDGEVVYISFSGDAAVYVGSSAPGSAYTGALWWDTDDDGASVELSGVTIDTNKDWQGYDITNLDLLDCNSISIDGVSGDCVLTTDTGRLQITNPNGYLYIGPNNGTWCHFYTDRSAYYFDKPVDWAGDMRPYTDNGYSLGSLTRGWANLYLMTAAYMNDTQFIDSSRNLSNIGTISCGDITVVGSTAYSPKIKLTNPTLTPTMESGYALTSATDSDTAYCNLIDYGVNYSSIGTVDSSLRGGVFRVDGRKNYALFQWNYRAPSGSNTVIATMNEAGAMSVGGLTTSGGINLNSAGANIQVQGANAKRTIVLTAGGGIPTTTAGCASAAKTELATNDVMITTLDFDQTTSESAQWNLVMPDNWDAGTLTARFYWTASGGTAEQTVKWGIQGRSYADDEALDQAPGTAVTTSDAYIAANDLHISGESSAITITGATAGEFVVIKVYRDISDTLASDAKLLAVKLEYGINAYSD